MKDITLEMMDASSRLPLLSTCRKEGESVDDLRYVKDVITLIETCRRRSAGSKGEDHFSEIDRRSP